MISPHNLDAESSATQGSSSQTPILGQTKEKQQNFDELIAKWRAMTFEESSIPSLAEKVFSSEPEDLYYGLIGLRKILSGDGEPPVQEAIDTNIVPRLIALMIQPSTNPVKLEAAWCLTNLCSGTTEQTQFCIDNGAISAFIAMLKVEDPEVIDQALWGLGNISGDNSEFRDRILEENGVEEIVKALKNFSNENLRRNAAWALSNICRSKPIPDYSLICMAVPQLCDSIKAEKDQQILSDVFWAVSYITNDEPGVESVVAQNVLPNLIGHLSNTDTQIVIPCLRTIGNLLLGTDEQTSLVLKEKNLLPELFRLTASPVQSIRREIFWILSNITAGTPVQFEGLMGNPAYVEKIIHTAKNDEPEVQNEAIWALSNATTNCTPAQIVRLLNNGIYECFLDLLDEEEDSKRLAVILVGIKNCLDHGKKFNLNDENGKNKFAVELKNKDVIDLLSELCAYDDNEVVCHALTIYNEYCSIGE